MLNMVWWDGLTAAGAVGIALALRPGRLLAGDGALPWPWLAWWAVLPVLWGMDRWSAMPLVQPMSGAPLLMLMAGWPLAVLALCPVAVMVGLLGDVAWADALHRLAWLGLWPCTVALALGALVRRWLPHHLFVYILGRGFLVPLLALFAVGAADIWLAGVPAGLAAGDWVVGRWLAAWGDAVLTGMWVSVFVAFRPQWLATYADRLYLPR